jgi:hypothetical protein
MSQTDMPQPDESQPEVPRPDASQVDASQSDALRADQAQVNESPARAARSDVPGIIRLLYTHNPFYLISSCLFVYGLKLLFRQGESAVLFSRGSVAYMEPWGLMASLAGVTVLMAVTAVLIVRIGRVWEDARSLLLIVMLMFLAISVSFDELVTVISDERSLRHAFLMFGAGTLLSVAVAEGMLRGLQIRLSWLYRGPLYALLIMFFAWPVLLLPDVLNLNARQIRGLIAVFPVAAGVLAVTLIPAVRRGSAAVRSNGTPWAWPWFPWTPFVFLAAAVCFRSYTLTISFDVPSLTGAFWDTSFGLYFLVPFLLSILLLLLEIGVVEVRRGLQRATLLVAPLLLVLAFPWLVPWSRFGTYRMFAYDVVGTVGSPVFCTLLLLMAFYGWAWRRGVRHADLGLFAMLLLATFVPVNAFGVRTWSLNWGGVQLWPSVVLGLILTGTGIRTVSSVRLMTGLACFVFAGLIGCHGTAAEPWSSLLVVHGALLTVLITGFAFRDRLAAVLRDLGAVQLSLTMIAGIVMLHAKLHQDGIVIAGYAAVMTAMALMIGVRLKESVYLLIGLTHCCIGLVVGGGWGVNLFMHARMPSGTKPVILAVVSFLAAVLISSLKSGLYGYLKSRWIRKAENVT